MNKNLLSNLLLVVILFTGIQSSYAMSRECTPDPTHREEPATIARHVSFDASATKSPSKDIQRLVNFYKMCVHAIRDGKLDLFETAFDNFFAQIPHNLKMNDSRFYKALFFVIANLFGTTYTVDGSDSYYLFLMTEESHIFVLEFNVSDTTTNPYVPVKFVPESKKDLEPISIIRIRANIENKDLLSIRLRKNAQASIVVNVSQDMFKTPLYSLNNPLRTIQSALEHLDGDHIHEPEKMHASITKAFTTLYASIPKELHVKNEKFYQSIFVCLMLFVRSGSIDQEVRSLIGRSDAVITTPNNTCIIEFKHKGSVNAAMQQIIDQRYCHPYHDKGKPIWMLGVNITKKGCVETDLKEYTDHTSPRRHHLARASNCLSRLNDIF